MTALAVREDIKTQIDTLPDEALPRVRDFVYLQKRKIIESGEATEAEKDEALEYLLNFPKRLPPDFNYKKALMESLDERYDGPDRH
jgi:hypothetical protein